MSTTTNNYSLVKPELSDVADITAMNQNWDTIDNELKKKYDPEADGALPISKGGTGAADASQARAKLGVAPKSYILHGTIDGHTAVTLTSFNWDELLAAANNPDVCVLMRLIDEDGAVCDFTMAVCDADEELATFYCYKDSTTIGVTVFNDGSIDCRDVAGFERWTFTLEDGSTVTKAVYVG